MHGQPTTIPPESRVTGHLQVQVRGGKRKWLAHVTDRDSVKRTRVLGPAHVKDSGKRTPRGATVWRAGNGPCPPGHLTPKAADDALVALLEEIRAMPRMPRVVEAEERPTLPTFGDAVDAWLLYLRVEKRRKHSTVQDAKNVANAVLLPHFGRDTPLYAIERREVAVAAGARERTEVREVRRDTFTTDDVDDFRRDLLDSHRSPRTVQKILVLLHGVLKLAKRRKLISTNPSEDAERVTVEDAGIFNVLEPAEFELVYQAVLGELDERDDEEREAEDAIDTLTEDERELYGAALSTSFYAGPRMGEVRDLPRRNVDFARSMLRIESGYTHGERSTPKGKRARSTPLVRPLTQRLEAVYGNARFDGPDAYMFCNEVGERLSDDKLRAVFYAALRRAGLGHRRDRIDQQGNPQAPMRVHDLRHSWCTWAVNAWSVTKVKEYAGHRDLKTTMRYVHHQTKAEDAETGGAYLDGILGFGAAGSAAA
ncbi:MAG TPA: tyrosine-type recombinase/integrase [Conexibacter sp.]|jgi:integrase|nr:tyrosine-type recombinase/integrase [Conexibacter sp.]